MTRQEFGGILAALVTPVDHVRGDLGRALRRPRPLAPAARLPRARRVRGDRRGGLVLGRRAPGRRSRRSSAPACRPTGCWSASAPAPGPRPWRWPGTRSSSAAAARSCCRPTSSAGCSTRASTGPTPRCWTRSPTSGSSCSSTITPRPPGAALTETVIARLLDAYPGHDPRHQGQLGEPVAAEGADLELPRPRHLRRQRPGAPAAPGGGRCRHDLGGGQHRQPDQPRGLRRLHGRRPRARRGADAPGPQGARAARGLPARGGGQVRHRRGPRRRGVAAGPPAAGRARRAERPDLLERLERAGCRYDPDLDNGAADRAAADLDLRPAFASRRSSPSRRPFGRGRCHEPGLSVPAA